MPTASDALSHDQIAGGDVLIFLVTGLVAGGVSALLGVGGGLIIIPILVLLGGFGQHTAEGTALAAMAPTALVSAMLLTRPTRLKTLRPARLAQWLEDAAIPATSTSASRPNWPRGLRLGMGGLLGAPAGAMLAFQLPEATLQRIFAVVLLAIAIHLLWTNIRLLKKRRT